MNYIKELNAFRDWLIFHPLPANAIALWHALMMVNNAVGWKEEFQAPRSTIETLSGLSKQRLYEARKALAEAGLIRYETGKLGEAATYQLIAFVKEEATYDMMEQENFSDGDGEAFVDAPVVMEKERNEEENHPFFSDDQSLVNPQNRLLGPNPLRLPDHSRYQTCDPNRYKSRHIIKHKQKQKQKSSSGSTHAEKNPFVVYEQNFGILRPISRESLIAWCEDLGDDIVIHAIELATKQGGRTFAYLEQILREWAGANVSKLEEVLAYEQQKKSNKKQRNLANNPKKSLFDELREEARLT